MAARVGVVVFPGSNCELDAVEAIRGARRATPSCCGTATTSLGGVDAVVAARRVRPRRLPAPGRHRPLLAGDGRGARATPPTAVRWSASATASRCSPRPACCPARCRRTAGLKFLCTTAALRVETTDSALTREARGRRRAAHPDQPLRGQLHLRPRHAGRAPGRGPHRGALRRQPQRLGRRHRRRVQRGPQRRRASCPTPSGPATPLLGSTDGQPSAAVAARERRRRRRRDPSARAADRRRASARRAPRPAPARRRSEMPLRAL